MIKNYLKTAWRNLVRNRGYSAINIVGLGTGMAVAMLIGLWVYDELSYNKYHKNHDAIAQVWAGATNPETSTIEGSTAIQFPIGILLKKNYGHHFKHVLMAWWIGDYTLSKDKSNFSRKGEFIEAGAPEMLSLKMLSGSYASLNDPHSIILSKTTADAIFGKEDPVNKNLKIDNRISVKVTGVYEDIPRNSRFGDVQFFSPWSLWVMNNQWIKDSEDQWDSRAFNIYVQLRPNTTMEAVNASIRDVYLKNSPTDYLNKIESNQLFAQLVPMKTWHLYSEFKNGKPAAGRITFVWLFGYIGMAVLILACINFMNLSTARSEKRAKEVGIRKAIGSLKGQLVRQFLSESFLTVVFAFILSFALLLLSLNWFNKLTDKNLILPLSNPYIWIISLLFIIATGFLAGLYPAFYLSSFKPVKVLKGVIKSGRLASLPRKILVVGQFAVSVGLIIGTIIIYQQIQHAQNRPIGYNKNGLISIPMNDPNYKDKLELIKTELLNTGMIENVGLTYSPLTAVWNNSGNFSWQGKYTEKASDFAICNVSHDFGKTVGWQIVAGRDFSKNFASDSFGLIVNEAAVKYMGLKNPIGELIRADDTPQPWTIIGVVKDLVMQSPYEPVKQTFFFLDYTNTAATQILLKIKPTVSANKALPKLEAVFKKIVPSASFDYKFIDEEFAQKFSQEERIGKLSGLFAGLAIFISCLGLFGLASFVAEQRIKEIGIRKVVGASVFNLWQMLSKDFVVLVIISCLIAIPVTYYYMHNWLEKYQYRTEISVWIFVVAIAGALLITLLTVSFHTIKAALANPVKCLRTE